MAGMHVIGAFKEVNIYLEYLIIWSKIFNTPVPYVSERRDQVDAFVHTMYLSCIRVLHLSMAP